MVSNCEFANLSSPVALSTLGSAFLKLQSLTWYLRFVGSERGIFEFKLNVLDRLQCPLIELC